MKLNMKLICTQVAEISQDLDLDHKAKSLNQIELVQNAVLVPTMCYIFL